MTTSVLTIAIPFRGDQSYLREAVQSVIAQECPGWRLIVYEDGGGKKGIGSMLSAYRDERIFHVSDTSQLDIARAYNRCLELADTDLVTLLHHDDRLRPNYVGNMVSAASSHPNAVGFFCRSKLIDASGRYTWTPRDVIKSLLEPKYQQGELVLQGEDCAAALLRANFIVGPTMCFRMSRLANRRFDPRWRQVLDFALNMRLLSEGGMLVGLHEPAYEYRRHAQQTTSLNLKNQAYFTEQSQLFDELAQEAERSGWNDVAKAARMKRIIKLDLGSQTIRDVLRLRWVSAATRITLLSRLIISRRDNDSITKDLDLQEKGKR